MHMVASVGIITIAASGRSRISCCCFFSHIYIYVGLGGQVPGLREARVGVHPQDQGLGTTQLRKFCDGTVAMTTVGANFDHLALQLLGCLGLA